MTEGGSKAGAKVVEVILLVEDNPTDAALVTRAFDRTGVENPIRLMKDGNEALAYLTGMGPYGNRNDNPLPSVILLDLHLPRLNGYQLMTWLRSQPELRRIPIVVLTESQDSDSINKAYDAGANSYLVKPGNPEDILRMVNALRDYWLSLNEPPRISLRGAA